MQIVLLAGGSGKRLWPLSNSLRSKQFLYTGYSSGGNSGTMISRVFQQVKKACPDSGILIATNEKSVAMLETIVEDTDFCIEPEQKDTFPAICLALAYLKEKKKVAESEVVVLCPVDVDAELRFFETFRELERLIRDGAHLALIAVQPDHPSNQFAYMLPEDKSRCSPCYWYREKPEIKDAEEYIEQGALWSGGVYAFELGYMLHRVKQIAKFEDYCDLYRNYHVMEKRSFACTVAEKEQNVWLIRYNGQWADRGNWFTFSEAGGWESSEYNIVSENSKNVRVINELNMPILCMGCDNIVIAASAGGILVSDLKKCTDIKPYVDTLTEKVMFAERTWGNFLILDVQKNSLTIKITLRKGHRMNYHSHDHRSEIWTIVSGKGTTIVDGESREVTVGDVIKLPIGCKHTVYATTDLHLVEVQLGEDISSADKKIFEQPRLYDL
ncbi:MAG: sugar phosphate nucleotidyltransferase [bacterium]|nr:sugar phosphate nucleotidyltransferase [bacterium]MCM1374856.1 sugar phosphate nucleotidyltransferase [Muribaculum sp.]